MTEPFDVVFYFTMGLTVGLVGPIVVYDFPGNYEVVVLVAAAVIQTISFLLYFVWLNLRDTPVQPTLIGAIRGKND